MLTLSPSSGQYTCHSLPGSTPRRSGLTYQMLLWVLCPFHPIKEGLYHSADTEPFREDSRSCSHVSFWRGVARRHAISLALETQSPFAPLWHGARPAEVIVFIAGEVRPADAHRWVGCAIARPEWFQSSLFSLIQQAWQLITQISSTKAAVRNNPWASQHVSVDAPWVLLSFSVATSSCDVLSVPGVGWLRHYLVKSA